MPSMQRRMLKSKIHGLTVTDADVTYEGSVTLDAALLDAANIREYEEVHVWDLTNGARLVTYAIAAPAKSGVACINGAGAKLVYKGDRIIVASFATYDEEEFERYQPRKIFIGENNQPALR